MGKSCKKLKSKRLINFFHMTKRPTVDSETYIHPTATIIGNVKIGKNCTIGTQTIVMPGAIIGDGTIVGACSLVTKNKKLEPNSLYLGVPARKVRNL